MKTASFPNWGRAIQWTYDRWGNRTNQAATQGSVTPIPLSMDVSTNRIPNVTNSLGQQTSDGLAHTFTYDGEGNVVKLDGNSVTYVYDALNRRIEVDYPSYSRQFTYDIDGNRVAKWNGNSTSPSLMTAETYWNGRPLAFWDASTASPTQSKLSIRFTNDASDGSGDRNVYVQSVTVGGQTISGSDNAWSFDNSCNVYYHNLYCNGTETATFNAVGPVSVTVSGSTSQGVGPHMQVLLNDQIVGEWDPPTSSTTYNVGAQVSVRFTNDLCDCGPGGSGDRNLYVQSVTMGNQTLSASDPAWGYDSCNQSNGGILCTGSMTASFNQFGPISVTAYGSTAQGIGPHMQVLVNGQVVGEWDVPTSSTTYSAQNTGYHFQQADLLGTERVRTNSYGQPEQYFTSLPFGDEFSPGGVQNEAPQFGLLDRDGESDSEHALYRQYSSRFGRWMIPDPYVGSYDFNNPQSLNRYAYVNNMPLSFTDPLGLIKCPGGTEADICGGTIIIDGHGGQIDLNLSGLSYVGWIIDAYQLARGIFARPHFHGSLAQRPNSRLNSAQCKAANKVLERESKYGTGKAARMSSVTWGDNLLGPFNSSYVPNLQTPIGEVDLDWFTDTASHAAVSGALPFGTDAVYSVGKLGWTGIRVSRGNPIGHALPFIDPGERNAVRAARNAMHYSDIFTPDYMRNACAN